MPPPSAPGNCSTRRRARGHGGGARDSAGLSVWTARDGAAEPGAPVGRGALAGRGARRAAARSCRPTIRARDWTFTPDLAPALARLVARPPAGRPVHLCSPFIVTDSAMAAQHRRARAGRRLRDRSRPSAPAKPPMRASDLSRLGVVRWTAPDAALAQLVPPPRWPHERRARHPRRPRRPRPHLAARHRRASRLPDRRSRRHAGRTS